MDERDDYPELNMRVSLNPVCRNRKMSDDGLSEAETLELSCEHERELGIRDCEFRKLTECYYSSPLSKLHD